MLIVEKEIIKFLLIWKDIFNKGVKLRWDLKNKLRRWDGEKERMFFFWKEYKEDYDEMRVYGVYWKWKYYSEVEF